MSHAIGQRLESDKKKDIGALRVPTFRWTDRNDAIRHLGVMRAQRRDSAKRRPHHHCRMGDVSKCKCRPSDDVGPTDKQSAPAVESDMATGGAGDGGPVAPSTGNVVGKDRDEAVADAKGKKRESRVSVRVRLRLRPLSGRRGRVQARTPPVGRVETLGPAVG